LWGVFLAAGCVAATLIYSGIVAHRDRVREMSPRPVSSSYVSSVSAGDAAARDAGAPKANHVCAGGGGACDAGLVAWCDSDERSVGCCERDRVAVGRDGGCLPPP